MDYEIILLEQCSLKEGVVMKTHQQHSWHLIQFMSRGMDIT